MRSLGLSLSGLACVVALIVIAPKPANSQPSVLPLVSSASGVDEVGYIIDGTDTAIVDYPHTMGTDTAIVVHTMGTDTAIVVRTMGTDTADGGKPTPVRTITTVRRDRCGLVTNGPSTAPTSAASDNSRRISLRSAMESGE